MKSILIALTLLLSLAAWAPQTDCPPITNNFACPNESNVKNITRFDSDADCEYDRWIYIYCDGVVVVTDIYGVLTGTPVGRVSATHFEVGIVSSFFNAAHGKWEFDIPIVNEFGAEINHIRRNVSTGWNVVLE